MRDVSLEDGVLNVQEWVDAIKSTGFEGWWACESFSILEHEDDVYDAAKKNYEGISKYISK